MNGVELRGGFGPGNRIVIPRGCDCAGPRQKWSYRLFSLLEKKDALKAL
jgi:hypothetical protein